MMILPKQTEAGTFLGDCHQLYEEMLREINLRKQNLQEEKCIQRCFEIAGAYKDKVVAKVRDHKFTNLCDEIYFFKHVKPLFHAEVEFYTYCYHIVLFKTKEMEVDKGELRSFYNRQLQRRDKLRKEFPAFYTYVEEGQTYADQQWFTRHSSSKEASLFDSVMGRYMAIAKFEVYLKEVMRKLK